jgi:ABC-type dipeptide/oligopeptide/nickel transport system permease subunit
VALNSKGVEEHFVFGADYLGRDVLSRTLYGTRVSLSVAIVAALVSLLVGLVYGTISGYIGGQTDNIMMRIVDFLWGFPFLIVVILLQTYFKALARQGGESSTPVFTFVAVLIGLVLYYSGIASVSRELDVEQGRLLNRLFWIQIGLAVVHIAVDYFAAGSLPQIVYTSILALIGIAHLALIAAFVVFAFSSEFTKRSSTILFFSGELLFAIGIALSGYRYNVTGFILDANNKMGGMLLLFIAIGLINWIGMSRLARGQVLSYKEKEFVEAARSIGASDARIIFTHLTPNIIGPLIVQETLAIPGYIFTEAFLSFIGLGVDAPTPSWGIMISESYPALRNYPWQTLVPAVALTLTTLAFNFLGDGLRDALDPRLKE